MKGKIGVTSENLFPIIKKFLYSDHDIFLREIVSNAVDASQKLKTLASAGKYSEQIDTLSVKISIDKAQKTLTVSDNGIGMTSDEVEKYINQIAFSGADEFLKKYKNDANAIIGHFGLGFYSSFMVSEEVEIISKSYKKNSKAVRWVCDGSPEFMMEETEKESVGTDIIMHLNSDSLEFLEENRITELLNKYCKFLPVPVLFGKKKEWKDGKYEDTETDNQINDVAPAWTKKPVDLKEEDYTNFYHQLYPMADEPLFNIHLNVDYPFNLTGILYFPKLKNNFEVQKNKIQLYSNQVFVTDSVEGIVPEFLTLLHGVLDSPDIPLNVSRSYLQNDSNVKKISSHITKKVADRLQDIFKEKRAELEEKWNDLKLFIEYGMLTDEKFYEKALKFFFFTNTENKLFTWDEYKSLIEGNQTDKNKKLVYLYATNAEAQFSFIEAAKSKGYDVLLMDDVLATPLLNHFEQKYPESHFVRVDADVVEKLIAKDDLDQPVLTADEKNELSPIFQAVIPKERGQFIVDFQNLGETGSPMVITQNEFMRRMKDMSKMQAGMSFYGEMPDSYNLVVNLSHPLVKKVVAEKESQLSSELTKLRGELSKLNDQKGSLEKLKEGKKEEEVPQEEKDLLNETRDNISKIEAERREKLEQFGTSNPLANQLVDLAFLANNMLKGEALANFVKRSIELIK
ncbi:MAG: molecular chaperone HtpG [Prolixibacteraceae bacterium]|nr:molecular chaperone HtpG [Prolixibacteraceae bacterium]